MKPESKLLILALALLILALSIAVLDPGLLGSTAFAQRPPPGGRRSPTALAGTGFTYQGQLKNGGALVNGNCDFVFSLWDAASSGNQIGVNITQTIPVTSGLFTTPLDFGANAFNGDVRWLASSVRCPSGGGGYTALSPRQPLTPAPMALALPGLYTQQNVTSPNVIGGNSGNSVSPGKYGATIGGGAGITDAFGSPCASCFNSINANYATIGGGLGNVISSTGWYATIGGGVLNTASGGNATIAGGGPYNTASGAYAAIGGGHANTISNTASYATIGGGDGNTISNTASYATIGGGFLNTGSGYVSTVGGGQSNTASANFATVGGGWLNIASGFESTIAGGQSNLASLAQSTVGGGVNNWATNYYATIAGGADNRAGGERTFIGSGTANIASANFATIGGGQGNVITTTANYATIGGGNSNTANNQYATIGGGLSNTSGPTATVGGGYSNNASGDYATIGGGIGNFAGANSATVPGGVGNAAQGASSFAAGTQARADHAGTFVWGDNTFFNINSSDPNQFIVRANGGFYFIQAGSVYTVPVASGFFLTTTTGAYLSSGGTWTNASDRNAKANFASVDGQQMLNRLMGLPIQTWNYTAEDSFIRHIGPTAQDFYAAFQLGQDDTHISTIDADGVALAAIQGLYQVVREKDAEIEKLKAKSEKQQVKIENLETRLAALEQANRDPKGFAERPRSQAERAGNPSGLGDWNAAIALVIGATGVIAYERARKGGVK